MEKFNSPLCQQIVLYTHYFNFQFLISIHFTNLITLKQSLSEKLNLVFKFSLIKRHINFHFGPTWDIKDGERTEKLL